MVRSVDVHHSASETERLRERLVDRLTSLARIDSPTGSERQISNHLAEFFDTRGVLVIQDPLLNVFARIPGKGLLADATPILWVSHMDTVEPGRGVHPIRENGVIKSDGTTILGADNKATLAVHLEIAERLLESQNGNHRPVEILVTTDEENTNTGIKGFDSDRNIGANVAVFSDCAGELGGMIMRSPAYYSMDHTLEGVSAHAAFPDRASSVLPAIGEIFSTVSLGAIDANTRANIGIANIGTARNTIPGNATTKGEVRSFNRQRAEEVAHQIDAHIKQVADKKGIKATGDVQFVNDMYEVDRFGDLIELVVASYSRVGVTPRVLYGEYSCSDANLLYYKLNRAGRRIQVINVTDGTIDTHKPQERIAIADLQRQALFFDTLVRTP